MPKVWEKFCSPCCRASLQIDEEDFLTCSSCHHPFRMESYGPDLMPPSIEDRYRSYPTWQSVQEALTQWRKRTWDGSAQAKELTRVAQCMADDFLDRLALHGQVLDIGCGSGWIAEYHQARGCIYAGIDPMPSQKEYPFPFASAVSDCLPFRDHVFDGCVFYSSIDYSLSIEETLKEAWRVLRPGGIMGISTPIQRTKEFTGERLHHYRFLAGEIEDLIATQFAAQAETHQYRENNAFIRVQKPADAMASAGRKA
jgi:SAM-dependent methyltransferase